MRLAGQVKMGYYPTPLAVVEKLVKLLRFPRGTTNVLDPCAGEGLALDELTRGRQVVTYAIELDGERAAEAKKRLAKVLHAGYEEVEISPRSMGLLYLNPPYDDGETERKELTFLRDLEPTLVCDGVLVYIIPQKRLSKEIAQVLASQFTDVRVYRFPDPEFGGFGQIVVLARKSRFALSRPEEALRLSKLAEEPLDPLPDYGWYHEIPTAENVHFERRKVNPEELAKMAERSPLWGRLRDLTEPAVLGAVAEPPTRLHVGHLGLLLSAGRLNGLVGKGPERHIVVGQPVKSVSETEETEYDGQGRATAHVTRRLETFRVVIKMLLPSGKIRRLGDPSDESEGGSVSP